MATRTGYSFNLLLFGKMSKWKNYKILHIATDCERVRTIDLYEGGGLPENPHNRGAFWGLWQGNLQVCIIGLSENAHIDTTVNWWNLPDGCHNLFGTKDVKTQCVVGSRQSLDYQWHHQREGKRQWLHRWSSSRSKQLQIANLQIIFKCICPNWKMYLYKLQKCLFNSGNG